MFRSNPQDTGLIIISKSSCDCAMPRVHCCESKQGGIKTSHLGPIMPRLGQEDAVLETFREQIMDECPRTNAYVITG